MNRNLIVALIILIILAGVGLFFFHLSTTMSYIAIGLVIIGFISLFFLPRDKGKGQA
jgi:uncharacterized protein YjeT (DUF2065 family)